MKSSNEKRKHPRHDIPLVEMLVDIPELSDVPLVPEDVSTGGFKVVTSREPAQGAEYEVTIHVADMAHERFKAEVTWARESESAWGTWSVSMKLIMSEEDRERFSGELNKLSELQAPEEFEEEFLEE
ncbi:MAG: PilZ domain-containing protein [bacterium]